MTCAGILGVRRNTSEGANNFFRGGAKFEIHVTETNKAAENKNKTAKNSIFGQASSF